MKRLCTPELGEDDSTDRWDQLPRSWPDRLDEAINALNHHILLALKFSPKELLLGIAINTPRRSQKRQLKSPQQRKWRHTSHMQHSSAWTDTK
jgi:hypothetical protein